MEQINEQDASDPLAEERAKAGKINALAFAFYGVAVLGAIGGQAWVATKELPWTDLEPGWGWVPWAVGLGLAAVLELLGVVTATMADWRRRLGEEAYALMAFSGLIATAATAINVLGHQDNLYAAAGFGLLSGSAYVLYLFHSAMRRRDALRARKAMAQPAPIYGWRQWRAEPEVTRRARQLAEANPKLGLHGSLTEAREQVRTEKRLKALAALVEKRIKSEHKDPTSAAIAANTYDLAKLATAIEARADYDGWADVIGRTLTPVANQSKQDRHIGDRPAVTATPAARPVTPPVGDQIGDLDGLVTNGGQPRPQPRRRALEPTEEQDRAAARALYVESVQAAQPLSEAGLGDRFGRGRSWGRARIAEVRGEIANTGEFPAITAEIPEGVR